MPEVLNIAGRVFVYLTVHDRWRRSPASKAKYPPRQWLCTCRCGKEIWVDVHGLMSGKTTSCGCRKLEIHAARLTTHGKTGTREHRIWKDMIKRCENPRDSGYQWYGALGVRVCARWRDSFEAFLADVGPRPSPQHSLDRFPNTAGNYEPGNVRWATNVEQARNKRDTRFLDWNGQRKTIPEWAEVTGLTAGCIRQRLQACWSIDRALSTPAARAS